MIERSAHKTKNDCARICQDLTCSLSEEITIWLLLWNDPANTPHNICNAYTQIFNPLRRNINFRVNLALPVDSWFKWSEAIWNTNWMQIKRSPKSHINTSFMFNLKCVSTALVFIRTKICQKLKTEARITYLYVMNITSRSGI